MRAKKFQLSVVVPSESLGPVMAAIEDMGGTVVGVGSVAPRPAQQDAETPPARAKKQSSRGRAGPIARGAIEKTILRAMRSGATTTAEMREAIDKIGGAGKNSLFNVLNRLIEAGIVARQEGERGSYILLEKKETKK